MSLELFLNSSGLTKTHPRLIRKIVNRQNKVFKRPSGAKRPKVPIMADFETTTDELDCRVWSWGLVEIEEPDYEKVQIGADIDSFITRIMEYNSTCYFHNLKFD